MNSIDEMQGYIDALDSASKRVRQAMVVMVTASVITFVAWWNILNVSWTNSAINLYIASVRQLKGETIKDSNLAGRATALIKLLSGNRLTLTQADRDELIKTVQNSADGLVKVKTEKFTYLAVPFFGVTVDINDLGILSGFSFVVVLAWFLFGLQRELSNLRITFGKADKEDVLGEVYDRVAMTQVFIVPRQQGLETGSTQAWVSRMLSVLPVLVLLSVFINDVVTREAGRLLNPVGLLFKLAGTALFLAVATVLTVRSLGVWRRIEKLWRETGMALNK